MSIYYKVLLYTTAAHDGRTRPSVIVANPGNEERPWGAGGEYGTFARFLWKEEAETALRTFMAHQEADGGFQKEGFFYERGRVVHVVEEGTEIVVSRAGEDRARPPQAPEEPREAPGEPEILSIDPEEGRRLLDAYEVHGEDDRPKRVQESRFEAAEWFFANAEDLLAAVEVDQKLRKLLLEGATLYDHLLGKKNPMLMPDYLDWRERALEGLDRPS